MMRDLLENCCGVFFFSLVYGIAYNVNIVRVEDDHTEDC